MKFAPSSTARRSTLCARLRSLGSPQMWSLSITRIAPKPRRLTSSSPIFMALSSGNGHGGDAEHDADQSCPQRRAERFSQEQGTDRYPDGDAQVGLRRGADRAERIQQAEVDQEGERGGK